MAAAPASPLLIDFDGSEISPPTSSTLSPPSSPTKRKKLASKLLARVPKEILEAEERARSQRSGGHGGGPPNVPADTPTSISSAAAQRNPFSPKTASTDQTTPEKEKPSPFKGHLGLPLPLHRSFDRVASGTSSLDSLPFALSSASGGSSGAGDERRRSHHASVPVGHLISTLNTPRSSVLTTTSPTATAPDGDGSIANGASGSDGSASNPRERMSRRMTTASIGGLGTTIEDIDILQLLEEMGRTKASEAAAGAGAGKMLMLDHKGEEFVIDEHTLSPVAWVLSSRRGYHPRAVLMSCFQRAHRALHHLVPSHSPCRSS